MSKRESHILSFKTWSIGILDESDIDAVKVAISLDDVQHIFHKINYRVPYDCDHKELCCMWLKVVIDDNLEAAFRNVSI